jgi:hypothetical protein
MAVMTFSIWTESLNPETQNCPSATPTSKQTVPHLHMAKPDSFQAARFTDAAREIGADETGEALECASGKIVRPKRPAAEPRSQTRKSRK